MSLTNQNVSVLFLFGVGILITAAVSAAAVSLSAGFGLAPGAWLVPLVALACSIAVFFLGRDSVLPPRMAAAPATALLVTSVWLVVTGVAAAAIVMSVRARLPLSLQGVFGIVPLWLLLILVSRALLAKLAAPRGVSMS